jgi:polysaccharide export outer membrane protein
MKKSLYLNIFLFSAFITILSSCIDQKKYIYFQKGANQGDTVAVAQAYVPKIQPGDLLLVINGSLNSAASSFFNPLTSGGAATSDPTLTGLSTATAAPAPSSGTLVDENGFIELPLVGTIKVAGLTTSQARDTIKNRLKLYVKEPTVNVRFLNYKISVMGEVSHPAVYIVPTERVSLPEAITMAGDLTPFARHDNILVIRDNNGAKEFGRVNINSRDIFTSPYYYLHSGDMIYVEQTKTKAQQNDPTLRVLPVVLSTVAAALLLIYRFK